MKNFLKKIAVMLSMVVVLSACGTQKEMSHQEHAGRQEHATVDIQEKTVSADVLPKFLKDQPEQVRIVYEAAGKATEILKWMPCYCGCGESAGHTSNMNCFIKEVNTDGSIVWDDHGTRCGVCLQIAVQSIAMKQQGKSLKEIRTHIDQAYAKGFAKSTDTPMPPL